MPELWPGPVCFRVNSTPGFSTDWNGQREQAFEMLGEERVKAGMGRYPDLVRDGVNVSISADVSSAMPDMQAPLFVIQAAVTMMDGRFTYQAGKSALNQLNAPIPCRGDQGSFWIP